MNNYYIEKKRFQIYDPIESYFECIVPSALNDGNCISNCVEIIKQNDY